MIWPCSIWHWTASSEPAICSISASRTSQTATRSIIGRRSCSRRPAGPCDSRLPAGLARPSMPGSRAQASKDRTISFRAEFGRLSTCRRGSIPGWSRRGWPRSVSIRPPMARTRCGEPRRPCSTVEPRTSGPYSCCWATRSSIARSAIWGSR